MLETTDSSSIQLSIQNPLGRNLNIPSLALLQGDENTWLKGPVKFSTAHHDFQCFLQSIKSPTRSAAVTSMEAVF